MNIYNVGYCLLHDENMYKDRIDSRLELTLPVSYQEDKYQTASHQEQQAKGLQLLKFYC